MERWKPIPDWPYEVSDHGRVRRSEYGKGTWPGRIISPGDMGRYPTLTLHCDEGRWCVRVHQLVLLAFVGPCPEGMNCNHKNGIKRDNRLCNLEYLTFSDNQLHAHATGLKVAHPHHGEDHGMSKVTWVEVEDIRRLYATGRHTQKALGERFGVGPTQISRIVRREQWA